MTMGHTDAGQSDDTARHQRNPLWDPDRDPQVQADIAFLRRAVAGLDAVLSRDRERLARMGPYYAERARRVVAEARAQHDSLTTTPPETPAQPP